MMYKSGNTSAAGIFFLLILFSGSAAAQYGLTTDPYKIGGYVQHMETVWLPNGQDVWQTYGTAANRLNVSVYPLDEITFNLGMRNILTYGKFINDFPAYPHLLTADDGFADLTWEWTSDTSSILFSNIDRLNINFSYDDLSITAGRQRINWGTNLVWNPNDIFNVFSYFDFDYVERPGCDAVRVEYFTGMLSSIQAAVKVDHNDRLTYAAMYRFNYNNYDYQLLAGVLHNDIVIGGGWSGNIGGAGFNGEFSYFSNKNNASSSKNIFISSIGANYTFENSLYIHGAAIFNSGGSTDNTGGFNVLFPDISAKNLTQAKYEALAEIQYPVTPLINAALAAIYNPGDGSAYISPSLDFSISNTVSFLAAGQIFTGDSGSLYGGIGKLFYARLKWNF